MGLKHLAVMLKILLIGLLLAGCATSQPKETRRYFWPQLPERPRIEWLHNYASEADFPKSGFKQMMTDVMGEEATITLERALDISVNSKNQVFIADPGLNNVVIFDFVANNIRLLSRDEKAEDKLQQPVAVALGENGLVYVGDNGKKQIVVYDVNGKKQRSFAVQPKLESVGGMAVNPESNRLYVADTRGHKIGVFDLQGNYITSFGKRGEQDGEFLYPFPLRFNRRNELIVGDTMNARIQIFDANGKFLRKFGNRGDGPQDFQVLKGVAVDSDDNIYVTDGKAHKVSIFSNNGDYLLTFGGMFSTLVAGKDAMGGFVMPQGIFIDANDRIYVVDQMNHRFQVFQYLSDRFIQANPIKGYDPNAKPTAKGLDDAAGGKGVK